MNELTTCEVYRSPVPEFLKEVNKTFIGYGAATISGSPVLVITERRTVGDVLHGIPTSSIFADVRWFLAGQMKSRLNRRYSLDAVQLLSIGQTDGVFFSVLDHVKEIWRLNETPSIIGREIGWVPYGFVLSDGRTVRQHNFDRSDCREVMVEQVYPLPGLDHTAAFIQGAEFPLT